eukprot:6214458-Pleurochrysis_carterae.AAC.2
MHDDVLHASATPLVCMRGVHDQLPLFASAASFDQVCIGVCFFRLCLTSHGCSARGHIHGATLGTSSDAAEEIIHSEKVPCEIFFCSCV